MNINWINTGGGPLICCGPSVARKWLGTRASSIGGPLTDYERACEQLDYVSVIPCDSSQVLVLGDEPLQSMFLLSGDRLIIIRWVSCLSKEHAATAIALLPSELPIVDKPAKFRLDETGLIMFDAAREGFDPSLCAQVEMQSCEFAVTSERYKSEGVYEFLIHRFVPSA